MRVVFVHVCSNSKHPDKLFLVVGMLNQRVTRPMSNAFRYSFRSPLSLPHSPVCTLPPRQRAWPVLSLCSLTSFFFFGLRAISTFYCARYTINSHSSNTLYLDTTTVRQTLVRNRLCSLAIRPNQLLVHTTQLAQRLAQWHNHGRSVL